MCNKSVQWCGLIVLFSVLMPLFHANAITVAPDRIEEELAPGDALTKNIRIFNENDETVLVSPELGSLPLPRDTVEQSPAHGLTPDLVSFNPDTFQLASGAWVDFPVKIQVLQIAEPGGYYGTLLFQFRGESADRGVGLVGKVGPLVLLSVIGSVRTDTRFLGLQLEERARGVFDHLPTEVSYKLKNAGNVHVVPHGTFIIKNWLGGEREHIEVNAGSRVLLPGWERTFIETLDESVGSGLKREWQRFGFGRYTAELTLTLGDRTHHYERGFWVIPGKLLGLAMLMITTLVALRVLVAHRERRLH